MKLKQLLGIMSETKYRIIVRKQDENSILPFQEYTYDTIEIDYLIQDNDTFRQNKTKRDECANGIVTDIHYNKVTRCIEIQVDLGE